MCEILFLVKRKKHGKEADPVTFFRECHTRKNEAWIDEESERTGVIYFTVLVFHYYSNLLSIAYCSVLRLNFSF